MKKLVILLVLLSVLLIAAVKPAQLTVKNRSDVDLVFYLFPIGEQGVEANPALSATVPFHSVREYSLLPGPYHFEVYGCEKVITGDAEIRGHFTLSLPNCERLEKAIQQRDGGLKFLPD